MTAAGAMISDVFSFLLLACAPAIILSGAVIFSYDGVKRLFHKPAPVLSRAKRFFIMTGVITLINLIIIFSGLSLWYEDFEDKELYNGSMTGSSGETVDVRVYIAGHSMNPKAFVELTDSEGRVTEYRVLRGAAGESSVPKDYISLDTENGECLIWVLDSSGEELLGLYQRKYKRTFLFSFDKNVHTYVSDNDIRLINAAEKTGFLDKLPDSSSKTEWEEQFRLAEAAYKEKNNDN